MNNLAKSRGKSAALNKLDKPLGPTSASTSNLLTIEQIPRAPKTIHRSQSSLNLVHPHYPKKFAALQYNQTAAQYADHVDGDAESPSPTNVIRRGDDERQKLPDRINLDKKGLTVIPFIEDEPNLRLLSLQHNLINTFHIPDAEKPTADAVSHLQRQRSTATLRSQLVLVNGNNLNYNGRPTNGSKPIQLTFLQQQNKTNLQQQTNRYTLKKSNSFINLNQQIITTTSSRVTLTTAPKRNHKLLAMQTPSLSVESVPPMTVECDRFTPERTLKTVTPRYALTNLVFLDLYDNQIEKIANLDGLKSLTVLLLGKNRITDISGLVSLKSTLRVLDLHGNKITSITQKISQLQELKSLNLAGNALRQIAATDFVGLVSLKELNLKRNRLKKLCGFDDLRSLERLWLCHNDIQKITELGAVAKAINLKEVTIQNNPVSLAGDCVSFLVSFLPALVTLSQMQITEQVRRAAMAWRRNKELSDKNFLTLASNVGQTIRREEIISNARTNWELLRSQQPAVVQKTVTNKIEVEIRSNVSEVYLKPASLVPQAPLSKTKQRYKPRTRNRLTADDNMINFSTVSTATEALDTNFFRLPPILAPYYNVAAPGMGGGADSSQCSMGPNIDSSSASVCSSENETTELLKEEVKDEAAEPDDPPTLVETNGPTSPPAPETAVTKPPKLEEKRPSLAIISLNEIELDTNATEDQISNLSTVSAKTTTESVQTTSSDDQHTVSSKASVKCRSAMPARKNYSGMLRAQTAKTFTPAALPAPKTGNNKLLDREREQGSDYLIEICGRYLNIYGLGSLKFIEKQWNVQKANDVHTIKFSYINFNSISSVLSMKTRFPNADHFVFRETNITCLGQLNALAETQGIASLTIEPEGNAVTERTWRHYAIYRLSHWGLKQINGTEISDEELRSADTMYAGLADLVLWSLPESLLQPLLLRLRLNETCAASRMTAKEWLAADPSLKSVVGKEALQWKKVTGPVQDEAVLRQRGKVCFNQMLENTCNAVEKLQRLDKLWDTMLFEIVRNALIDYSQIDAYVRNLLNELK